MTDPESSPGTGGIDENAGEGKPSGLEEEFWAEEEESWRSGPGQRGEQGQPGSFVLAALMSTAIAGLGISCLIPSTDYGDNLYPGAIIWVSISCFVGGCVGGFCIQKDLRFHGWRLLWLAAVSPALLVWVFTVLLLLTGAQVELDTLIAVLLACGLSVGGSLAGYHFNVKWSRAAVESFYFRIAMGFVVPLVAGTLAMLGCLWVAGAMALDLLMVGDWESDMAVAVFLCILFAPGFLLGGFLSGVLVTKIVPFRRWRRVLVLTANPSLPVLFFVVGALDLFGPRGVMVAALLLPLLGAIFGHKYVLRKRLPSGEANLYRDPGVSDVEEDESPADGTPEQRPNSQP